MASFWKFAKGLVKRSIGSFWTDVRRGFEWNERDEKATAFYRQFVPPNGLVFDVGANVGNRVKCFLRIGARVIAVEPQPDCARSLRRGWGTSRRLTVIEKALGAQEGEGTINLASASAIASMSREWIDAVKSSGRFAEYNWEKQIKVGVTTLDELIAEYGAPDFLKIDVEGFELEVLKGLSRCVRALSFEFTPECADRAIACIDRLASLGPIEVNLSLGESLRFETDQWETPEAAKSRLRSFAGDAIAFGDVYVRQFNQAS